MKKFVSSFLLISTFFVAFAQIQINDSTSFSPKQIIENYIEAIGGRDAYLNIKDRTMFMTATMQGMNIKFTIYQKEPNKLKNVIEVAGMEQVILFDGSKGYMKVQDKTIEITGNELEKLSYEANIHLATQLDSLPLKLNLLGLEKVEDKDAYKIEFSLPSGEKWVEFYDKVSFLKVKEIKEVAVPQGTFTQETSYSDYRDFMGFKFPYKINQKVGPQVIDLNVKSIEINTNLKDSIFE